MKVLVISLLRIGDLLMQAPALKGIRDRYPDCKIDLLVNRQCASIVPLFPNMNRTFLFDRDNYQKAMASAETHLYASYFALETLINELNEQDYDLILNWTHNRVSGFLMGSLNSKNRLGLEIKGEKKNVYGNWFQYLNQTQSNRQNLFHYSDFFIQSLGLEAPRLDECLNAGTAQASKASGLKIAIQVLTADPKKNWPLSKYANTIESLLAEFKDCSVSLLSAPSEKPKIELFKRTYFATESRVQIFCANFADTFQLLNQTDLLITGDTSIKHLASYSRSAILEIILGSSQMHETGVYKEGQWMIQNMAACSPCPHRDPCAQKSHLCSERISASVVTQLAISILKKEKPVFTTQETERNNLRVYVSRRDGQLMWQIESQFETVFEPNSLIQNVDRSVWKFILSQRDASHTFQKESSQLLKSIQIFVDYHFEQTAQVLSAENERTLKALKVMDEVKKMLTTHFPRLFQQPSAFKMEVLCLTSFKEEIQKKLRAVSDPNGYTRSL
ncbi:MAG: glycosyltransferase family 9 protein, partial [Pseudobdellovibrionaceae bacterium]